MNPHKNIIIIVTVFIAVFTLIFGTQGNLSYFLLFPILILTFLAGWYLNGEIQKDHEENLKRGIRYAQEEEEAQHWLHQSAVPKTRLLLNKERRNVIVLSGVLLLGFILLWSFFINGLVLALLYTLTAGLLYIGFAFYILHAPKKVKSLYKHFPKSVQHYRHNNWVHGYLLLLPFITVGFFLLSLINSGGDIIRTLLGIPVFIFFFTLLYISLYCVNYLYQEYKAEEERALKKSAKKMMDE